MNALTLRPLLLAQLTRWVERGWLRPLDLVLAQFLADELPDMGAAALLLVALVSHQLGRGHVCLDLCPTLNNPQRTLAIPPEGEDGTEDTPPGHLLNQWSLSQWLRYLDSCTDWISPGVTPTHSATPLTRRGTRLYLTRYWRYERQIEQAIDQRLQTPNVRNSRPEEVRPLLDALFPTSSNGTDWQKVACALALRRTFTIITGGPGTGKTTTVVRLLALLQSLALREPLQRPLRIRLATPTGKAAARLKESIIKQISHLPDFVQNDSRLRDAIPNQVTTLHRLLGTQPDSRAFRHHAGQRLPVDVLVVDEASMVDLEMMAALLQALPESATLILLGDKDQLASVEAGSVLGELCQRADEGHYAPETIRWISHMSGETLATPLQDPNGLPLDQAIAMLRVSHRFRARSGIGQLAQAVNQGATANLAALWQDEHDDLARHDLPDIEDHGLARLLIEPKPPSGPQNLSGYLNQIASMPPVSDPAARDDWARTILNSHARFQLLCALRQGPYGVEGLNRRIEQLLIQHGLIRTQGIWYAGRPVLVTRNDYALGLMNGDIGITLPYPEEHNATPQGGSLRVAFTADDNQSIRWILPSRLLHVETVFALTVHKSQGSEFEHAALLLPPTLNPVLNRALLYTGITRAKSYFSLINISNSTIIEKACQHTPERSGGLFGTADGCSSHEDSPDIPFSEAPRDFVRHDAPAGETATASPPAPEAVAPPTRQ